MNERDIRDYIWKGGVLMRQIQFISKDIWGREMGDRSLLIGTGTINSYASEASTKIKIKNNKK